MDTDGKRYVVHDFLIGNPVLLDRAENTMTFYKHNIYGQIYNLKDPEHRVIGPSRINGLIRRTSNPDYSFANSKAVDGYIYKYLMTPVQQSACYKKPDIPGWNELITATNDYSDAIKAMCGWVYEHEYHEALGDKGASRDGMLKYCSDFLAGRQSAPLQHKHEPDMVIQSKKHDRGDR